MVSFRLVPSWIYHLGSRKRQVMSPTMAPVPASPFTFSQLLRSQYLLLLLLLVLGLPTGTVNVPTLLSLALCNRLDSRAEPLFTTIVFTHTTATYCRFHVACAVRNFAIIIMVILGQFPTRVYPPPHGHRVPGRAGGLRKAGGPVQMAHLASKQTEKTHLPVFTTTTHTPISTLTFTQFN